MQRGTDTMQGGWTLYRGDGHYSRGGTDSTIEGTDTLQGGRTLYKGGTDTLQWRNGHYTKGRTDTRQEGDRHFIRGGRTLNKHGGWTLYKRGEGRTLDKGSGRTLNKGRGDEHYQKGKGVSASVSSHVCEFI